MSTQEEPPFSKAKNQLIYARQPFDAAMDAINAAERQSEYLIGQILPLFKALNPEWEDATAVVKWLRLGKFPIIAERNGDLRINGKLNEIGSLSQFLKDNMKEGWPVWEP